ALSFREAPARYWKPPRPGRLSSGVQAYHIGASLALDEIGPSLHQARSLAVEIAAPVRGLQLVADHVSQAGFDDVSLEIGLVRCPALEAGPGDAVRGHGALLDQAVLHHAIAHPQHGAVGHWLAGLVADAHDPAAVVGIGLADI